MLAVSTVAGLLIFWAVKQSGYIHLGRAANVMNFDNILPSFRMLTRQLSDHLLAFDFRSVVIFLAIISLLLQAGYLVYRFVKKKTEGV